MPDTAQTFEQIDSLCIYDVHYTPGVDLAQFFLFLLLLLFFVHIFLCIFNTHVPRTRIITCPRLPRVTVCCIVFTEMTKRGNGTSFRFNYLSAHRLRFERVSILTHRFRHLLRAVRR